MEKCVSIFCDIFLLFFLHAIKNLNPVRLDETTDAVRMEGRRTELLMNRLSETMRIPLSRIRIVCNHEALNKSIMNLGNQRCDLFIVIVRIAHREERVVIHVDLRDKHLSHSKSDGCIKLEGEEERPHKTDRVSTRLHTVCRIEGESHIEANVALLELLHEGGGNRRSKLGEVRKGKCHLSL